MTKQTTKRDAHERTKQTTKRDAAFYQKKANEAKAKEDKAKEIKMHKDALAKLREKK